MTPSIRFSDFTEDYKSYALHTFMSRIMRKNTKLETDIPLTISSQDGLVDQRTYFGKTIASSDMSGYYLLKNGEFTYNKSTSKGFPFGSIKRLDKYPCGAVSTLYICFALREEAFDSDYIEHYFDSQKWNKEVSMICAEGARNHGLLNVPIDDFFDTLHHLPLSIYEQQKIAAFLSAYDEKIALQKDRVETLEERKKGLLQKVFSQEIRFKIDDGIEYPAWEECAVKSVAQLLNGYTFKSSSYAKNSSGKYNIITIANVTGEKYISISEKTNKIALLPNDIQEHQKLQENNILISLTGNVGRVSLNRGKDNLLNQRVGVLKCKNPKIVEKYLYYSLANSRFQKSMEDIGQGAAQKNISKENVEAFLIFLPNVQEQQRIADFFTAIDTQISLAKEKLETLQEIKKGLLQQMFC